MNGGDNGGLFFLDTNILVYSLATNEPRKQPVAAALLQNALDTHRGFISTQVVQEFLNLATRRANPVFTRVEAVEYLNKILWPLCGHFPSHASYERALQIRLDTSYSFYDALIVTAAIESGCSTLLTEDLQHGRNVQGLTILNPFIDLE